ncbi:hypothetical protein lerEdw1_006391 [Lerista edwardsae]|nr:hypothetical protein lerEdw1_006391 [Lerista edwardsae]
MPDTCEAPARPGGPITLNVGGKLYSTTLETLTRFPDTMLGAMFRGPQPALTDSRGNYFIDRDGKAFRHILNFLRFGQLDLPEGYAELSLLRTEADFYQIRPLLEELRRVEAERWRQRANAVLHADVDVRRRLLHFNVRKGPQNYELRTCSLQTLTANVFCTDRHFLGLLRRRLGPPGCRPPPEEVECRSRLSQSGDSDPPGRPSRDGSRWDSITTDAEPRGWTGQVRTAGGDRRICPGDSTDDEGEADDDEAEEDCSRASPAGTKACHHLFLEWTPCPAELPAAEYAKQKLRQLTVGGREVRTASEFLEEVLKVALAHGFRVDSVFPDPADILNAQSLRFVRH